ncbi:rhodanese-like domain-containing protein [Legionella geestiana]|uniref:rhodanese-like domain-containing protein n=1 Tax=Legionella geestiana TaxID=45065 RepID=UPI001651B1AD|nr:rhodanese-like domain-containing protein [Legionella geestiana]
MAMHVVDAKTLKQWLERDEAVLVDVRECAEHAEARIAPAMHVPLATLSRETLPAFAGKKLVLHCAAGVRSARGCERLLAEWPELEVYSLEGGIQAWAGMGYPVDCGA